MTSRRVRKITRKLEELGAAWATCDWKHLSLCDPLSDIVARRLTWQVHPAAAFPHSYDTLRFDTLDELEEWISDSLEQETSP